MRPTLRPRLVNGRFGDPALFVEQLHQRSALLFDLGDLAALSARDLLRVDHVFVSHMHIDHFIGLDVLLRVHVGRSKRIVICGPAGIGERVGHKLAGYEWDLVDSYEDDLVFEVIELASAAQAQRSTFRLKNRFTIEPSGTIAVYNNRVVETADFVVTAAILEHHGPSVAYAVAEPLHVNIWGSKVRDRGLALGPWLKPLKQAVREGRPNDWPVTMPDASKAPLGSLRDLVSVEPGQKVGYVTDLRDTPDNRAAVARLCQGADLLFIEASFAVRDKDKADARAHLTTAAAGEIARAAGARRIEPFHFSPRYKGMEAEMAAEVETAFRRAANAA